HIWLVNSRNRVRGGRLLTADSGLLTRGFDFCAESATWPVQPWCAFHNPAFMRLRPSRSCVMWLLRIHAWDRLSVATRRQHTLNKCGRVSANRRGDPAKRMTDF